MSNSVVALVCVIAVLIFWAVGVHNRLIRLRNSIYLAHAKLNSQLEQRDAMLARWLEAARVYIIDAPALLEATTSASGQARVAALALKNVPFSAESVRALELAESVLSSAIRAVQAQLANDTLHTPFIAVDQRFSECAAQLAAIESAVAFAKEAYNRDAWVYNAAIVQFPASVLAAISGRHQAALWGNYP